MLQITASMVPRIQAWSDGTWASTWAQAAADPEWAPVIKALVGAGIDPTQMVLDFRRRYKHPANSSNVAQYLPVWNSRLAGLAPAAPSVPSAPPQPLSQAQVAADVASALRNLGGATMSTVAQPSSAGLLSSLRAATSAYGVIQQSVEPIVKIQPVAPTTSYPSVFNPALRSSPGAPTGAAVGGSSNLVLYGLAAAVLLAVFLD